MSARPLAIACIVSLIWAISPSSARHRQSAIDRLPRLFVWAWERPEDLRSLDAGIGVAFLAQTITIAGDRIRPAPRRQPLRVAPDATVIAVTRIEASASLASAPVDSVVRAIAATAALPRVAAVQIDFDAVSSQRAFYRELLRRLRDRVPQSIPLSITALASWCVGDDWLDDLPIDEAVPMLFRMGPANAPFLRLARTRESASRSCRGAVGMSLDEPIAARLEGRRVYIFNPLPWTEATLFQARRWVRE